MNKNKIDIILDICVHVPLIRTTAATKQQNSIFHSQQKGNSRENENSVLIDI